MLNDGLGDWASRPHRMADDVQLHMTSLSDMRVAIPISDPGVYNTLSMLQVEFQINKDLYGYILIFLDCRR